MRSSRDLWLQLQRDAAKSPQTLKRFIGNSKNESANLEAAFGTSISDSMSVKASKGLDSRNGKKWTICGRRLTHTWWTFEKNWAIA
jgi:hypothetical protein